MNKIFIVKDRTDASFYKPFVSLHKDEKRAIQKVSDIQAKLSAQAMKLVSYEPFTVEDFDPNRSSVYVIFDKTDNGKKYPSNIAAIHFDFKNAEQKVQSLKKGLAPYAQKLVFAKSHNFE